MTPSTRPGTVIGLDVGKSSHRACALTREGEIPESAVVPNREGAAGALYARHPGAGRRRPGPQHQVARALARGARGNAARMPARPRRARTPRLFAGDAKTDERDAMAAAKTAPGIPDAPLPVADRPPETEAARSLAAQRDFPTRKNTGNKNRLRSILLESCPEFESRADLPDAATPRLMPPVGGPRSIADTSPQTVGALTRGRGRAKAAAPLGSDGSSESPVRRPWPARTAPCGCSREESPRTPPRSRR